MGVRLEEAEVDRLRLVADASALLAHEHEPEAILHTLGSILVPRLGDLMSVILLRPDGSLERVASIAREGVDQGVIDALRAYPPTFHEGTAYHTVVTTRAALLLPVIPPELVARAAQNETHRALLEALAVRSSILAPILHHGEVLGVLSLATVGEKGRTLGRDDEIICVDLAQRVGGALANARHLARARELQDKLTLLAEASARLVNHRDEASLLDDLLGLAGRLIQADAYAVWLQEQGRWSVRANRGLSERYVRDTVAAMNPDAPLPARPFRLGGLSPGSPRRKGRAEHQALREAEGIRDTIVFPLKMGSAPDGTIVFYYRREKRVDPNDLRLGETLAGLASTAIASQRAAAAREASEATVRERDEWLRALFDSLTDALLVVRVPERLILRANRATAKVLGYEPEELLGRETRFLHVDEEHYRAFMRKAEPALRADEPVLFQFPMRRKDGSIVQTEHSLVRLRDPSGDTVTLVSVIRDISRRLATERAARQSDAELRSLIEQSPYSIQTYAPDGHILSVNPAWERLFGVKLDMVRDYNVLRDPQVEAAGQMELVRRAFAGEALALTPFPWTPDRGEKAGRPLWLRAVMFPIKDDAGNVTRVALMHEDFTAQKLAEDELQAARTQLLHNEKLAALGTLVGGVAHEIRTPLTYLANNLHLVEAALRRPDPARTAALPQFLAQCHDSIERIDRIVEDLRRFTRLKAGERAPARLRDVLAGAVELFRATHRGDVRVEADLACRSVANVDRVQVQQVVLNLLTNAAEARPRDGRVVLRARDEPGRVVIQIIDQGAGMSEEVLRRAFDPFFTTKPQGTGLGLSIVKRILEEHGGSIHVASKPGEGTTLEIALPAQPEAA